MVKLDYVKLREISSSKSDLIEAKLPYKPHGMYIPVDGNGLRLVVQVDFEYVHKMPLSIEVTDDNVIYTIPLEIEGSSGWFAH